MSSKVLDGLRRVNGSWVAAAKTVLRHPNKAWNFWRRTGSHAWIDALFPTRSAYDTFASELAESGLLDCLKAKLANKFSQLDGTTARGNSYSPGAMLSPHVTHLYAIIRQLNPRVIVETGVCNGFSSSIILAALARNQRGHLNSIDLPELTGNANTE